RTIEPGRSAIGAVVAAGNPRSTREGDKGIWGVEGLSMSCGYAHLNRRQDRDQEFAGLHVSEVMLHCNYVPFEPFNSVGKNTGPAMLLEVLPDTSSDSCRCQ